jgi:hypothetical protein
MKPTIFKIADKSKGMIALVFLLLALSLQNCKKFVQIPPPNTQLVTGSVFANNATATSAQIAIYAQMAGDQESYTMAQNMGLYADELQNNSSTSSNLIDLYTNNLSVSADDLTGPWVHYYNYIFGANSVISGLQATAGCSPAVKMQLTGEALFTRAFLHFYLTNIYGAVPLVLTTDPNITGKLARTPRVQVLQQVVTDLQSAVSLLNSNYVDGTDTVVTTQRLRPNKAAALALLARTYLYLGDYSGNQAYYVKADSAATAVIGNSNYSLSSLSGVFLENSTEAIWQWQLPQPSTIDTYDGDYFILTGAPGTGTGNSSTISSQLMGSFESGDQRMTNWIGSVTAGGNTYYFPYKYKVGNTYANKEYVMVLRLAEQYLIRAEARAHEGNLTGSAADLNMIRTRAGLPNTTATTSPTLLLAILHEEQVELFTEWGHRWFDLQRAFNTNLATNAATIMNSTGQNVCAAKGGIWNSDNHQLLFPVPQLDINADYNLSQNPGY